MPLTSSQKNMIIRTVVNKVNNIHSQFRYFEMELLAGEPDYVVDVVCTSLETYMNRKS